MKGSPHSRSFPTPRCKLPWPALVLTTSTCLDTLIDSMQEALAVLRPLNHDQFVTMLTNFYRGLKGERPNSCNWHALRTVKPMAMARSGCGGAGRAARHSQPPNFIL